MSSPPSNNILLNAYRRNTAPLSVLAPLPYHGILAKYVNLTTGYRNRYFVLQNGVLVYYKINHDHQVPMQASELCIFPSCDSRSLPIHSLGQTLSLVEHELVSDTYRNLIGEGVKVYEEMGRKCVPAALVGGIHF